MMTPITILSALLPLAASRALEPRQEQVTTDFGLIALHSTSAVHLSSINAADSKFWIGRDTQTYCPVIENLECPDVKYTAFAATSGEPGLGLNTIVPGGQRVYVAPSGALGFTQAHSSYAPTGSKFITFNVTLPAESGTVGRLTYNNADFLACPTKGRKGPYQVFANIPGIKNKDVPGQLKNCIGFTAGVAVSPDGSEGKAAWQYV